MEIKAEEKIERPPIWGSCRMVITILAFFGNIFIYILRLNFGIAIVSTQGETILFYLYTVVLAYATSIFAGTFGHLNGVFT